MVKVKLFGLLRLDSGLKELEIEADCVRDIYPRILDEMRRRDPACAFTIKELKACIVSVNEKQARPGTRLRDGDLVYLLPPVAGG